MGHLKQNSIRKRWHVGNPLKERRKGKVYIFFLCMVVPITQNIGKNNIDRHHTVALQPVNLSTLFYANQEVCTGCTANFSQFSQRLLRRPLTMGFQRVFCLRLHREAKTKGIQTGGLINPVITMTGGTGPKLKREFRYGFSKDATVREFPSVWYRTRF